MKNIIKQQQLKQSQTSSNDNFLDKLKASKKRINSRGQVVDDEYGDMKYNELAPEQMQSMGSRMKDLDWVESNGYTLLNSDRWKPPQAPQRPCIAERECPVCPSMTTGYPVNLLDFEKSRYVLGPDNINVDYIKKLNNPYKY